MPHRLKNPKSVEKSEKFSYQNMNEPSFSPFAQQPSKFLSLVLCLESINENFEKYFCQVKRTCDFQRMKGGNVTPNVRDLLVKLIRANLFMFIHINVISFFLPSVRTKRVMLRWWARVCRAAALPVDIVSVK